MGRRIRPNIAGNSAQSGSWHPEQLLQQALHDRDTFLSAHPHQMVFQRNIDTILDKAGTPENRLAVLALMLEGKIDELNRHVQHLIAICTIQRAL